MLKYISYFYNIFLIKVFYFFFIKVLQYRVKKIIKKRFYKNWNLKNIDLKLFSGLIKKDKLLDNSFSRINIDIILNSYTTVEILDTNINSVYLYLLYQMIISKKKSKFKSYIEKNLGFSLKKDLNKLLNSEKLGGEILDKNSLTENKELILYTRKNDKNFVGRYINYLFILLFVLFLSLASIFFINNKTVIENIDSNLEQVNETKVIKKEEKKSNIGEPEEKGKIDTSDKEENGTGTIEDSENGLEEEQIVKEEIIENDFSNLKEDYDPSALKVVTSSGLLDENNNKYQISPDKKIPSKLSYLSGGFKYFFDTASFKNDVLKRFAEKNKTVLGVLLEIFLIQLTIVLSFWLLPKLFNRNLLLFILILFPLMYLVNSSFHTYNFYIYFSYSIAIFFALFFIYNLLIRSIIGEEKLSLLTNYYKSFKIIYITTYSLIILSFIPAILYLFNLQFFDSVNIIYYFDESQLTYADAISQYSRYLGIIFFIFMVSFNIIYYNFNSYIRDFFNEYKKSALSRDLETIINTNDKISFWEGLIDKKFIIEGNKLFLLKFLYLNTRINKSYFSYLKNLSLSLRNKNIFYYKQMSFSFPKNIFYDRIKYIWEEGDLDTSGIRSEDRTSVSYIREKNKFEDASFLKDRINSKKSRSIGKIVINEYNQLDDFSDKHYYLYINLNTILQKENLLSLNKIFREIERNRLHIYKIKLFLNAKEYKNIGFVSTHKLKHNLNEVFNEIKIYGNRVMFPDFLNMVDEKGNIKKKHKQRIDSISLYLNGIFGKLDFFRETGKLSLVTNKKNDKENFIYLGFKKDIKIKKAIVY